MKTYSQFHGETPSSEIGTKLRSIVKSEKNSFKITTGYGSSSGSSKSKISALKSLSKMKKEGLIRGYFPGEVKHQLLAQTSPYYDTKIIYGESVKTDPDFGNYGVIFVFVR